MRTLHRAIVEHHVGAHTAWAASWTAIFVGLAVTIGGDDLRPTWALIVAVLLGTFHLLFRVGRMGHRRGVTQPLTRRATWLAWLFPAAMPFFVLWHTLGS